MLTFTIGHDRAKDVKYVKLNVSLKGFRSSTDKSHLSKYRVKRQQCEERQLLEIILSQMNPPRHIILMDINFLIILNNNPK